MRGQNIINLFCGLTGNVSDTTDFSKDLPRQFACVATDFTTGEEVILDHGSLPTALYASMAIPAAFEPIVRDGRLLVDGGLTNNFPVDVAKKMGADIVIGVDIRAKLLSHEDLNDIIDIVGQLASLYDPVKGEEERKGCHVLIRPDVDDYSIAAFNNQAVDSIIVKGAQAAEEAIQQIRDLKTPLQSDIPSGGQPIYDPVQMGSIIYSIQRENRHTVLRPAFQHESRPAGLLFGKRHQTRN